MLLQVGRVCVKKFGRDAGSRVVITGLIDNNFVKVVTSKRPKERRCNAAHLEFLDEVVDVNNKEQVYKALGITMKKQESAAVKRQE